MIREIFKANINLLHLTIRAVAFGGLTFVIMFLLFPLNFMLMFGAGVSADRLANTTLAKVLWLLSGFIVLTPFAIYRIKVNFRKGNLSKAKDYLLLIILTLIVSIAFYLWFNQSIIS